jgi:PAS domain S-box-containing protein
VSEVVKTNDTVLSGERQPILESFIGITERKRTEGVLQEAEERYCLLFEISTNAILIRDRKGIIRLANPAALSMLKASRPDEIIGKAYLHFVHPEDHLGSIDRIQRQIRAAQGEPGIDPAHKVAPLREHRLLTLAGETIYVESTGIAFWHQGQIWIQGNFHDITQRKHAEEALHKSEKLARRMAQDNAIVAEIGRIINSSLRIKDIYEKFAEKARQLVPFNWISISIIDRERGTFRHAYNSGDFIPERGIMEEVPLAGSLTGEVMRRRSMRILELEDKDEMASQCPELLPFWKRGYRAFMAIPLASADQVVGALHVYSKRLKVFHEADVSLGERIAAQISGAIANIDLLQDRKRAEEALCEREERYKSILEGMEEGYFEVDLKGRFTIFNDSLRNMLGFPKHEMTGMSYKEYTDEETARKIYKTFNQVYNSGKPVKTFDWEITRKDGKKAFLESSIYPIRNAHGERTGFRGIVRDVTEREKMEEALRRSEEAANRLARENAIIAEISRIISSTLNIEEVYERFGEEVRKLIPFERIAINLIDPKNYTLAISYVLGSQAFHRQLGDVFPLAGTAAEQIIKTRSSLFIQVKNRDEIAAGYPGLLPILDAGYQSIIMVPLISKNEVIGVFNIQSKKADAYDEIDLKLIERVSMQISGAIANAQLFAERRRALEQFMRSEERYRNLVEHSPDMILLYKKEELVYVNPAALRILGAARTEDLIGKSVFEIMHSDYRKVAKNCFERAEEGKEGPLLEGKFIRLDGMSVDVELMASTIFYQEEPMVQIVARDITERKRAAEQMAGLQMQLFQSQKMEAIGQLAGGFAHDFNNSLTLIKTCSQLTLLELKESDPLREKIEIINDAADHSANLSRHLLAFSRRQVMESNVLDLNNLIKDLDRMLHRVIGEDIDLSYVYAQNLGRVKADPVQIQQVILNLVINARDAMPKGGKLIIETSEIELDENYVHAHVKMTPGRYVLLMVNDTGTGMTPEVRERIFEPFFTTKPRGKGTGLGLSTAYGIVKQSGGYIWAYSDPGVGSTFKIYLPRVEEPVDEEKGKALARELLCRGETLLVVEDEKYVRLLLGKALRKKGYNILEASNGGEALLICEEHKDPIHLLLSDVIMPRMSGPDLAQRLRLLHPVLKVLYMSGYAHDAITHHGILEKGINFIQKPFPIEKLTEKVHKVLKN